MNAAPHLALCGALNSRLSSRQDGRQQSTIRRLTRWIRGRSRRPTWRGIVRESADAQNGAFDPERKSQVGSCVTSNAGPRGDALLYEK